MPVIQEGTIAYFAQMCYSELLVLSKSAKPQDRKIAINGLLAGILVSLIIASSLPHSQDGASKILILSISVFFGFVLTNVYLAGVKILVNALKISENNFRIANGLLVLGILIQSSIFFGAITPTNITVDAGIWDILNKISSVLGILSFAFSYLLPSIGRQNGMQISQSGSNNSQVVIGGNNNGNVSISPNRNHAKSKPEILATLMSSSTEDWTAHDEIGEYVFDQDVNLKILRLGHPIFEKDYFSEPWVGKFANQEAFRQFIEVRYNGNLVHKDLFVIVDGARAYLPAPESADNLKISPLQFKIGEILNKIHPQGEFDKYLHRAGFVAS
ncbi:hypothetical protein HYV43_00450 [Candidatus Micrarchaeota archaeon]|nr:hypothetical protein [Candidatus Micrarchaeota archaeon]